MVLENVGRCPIKRSIVAHLRQRQRGACRAGVPSAMKPHDRVGTPRTSPLQNRGSARKANPAAFAFGGRSDDSVFAIRKGENIYVYENFCPHNGSSMSWIQNSYLTGDGSKVEVLFARRALQYRRWDLLRGPLRGRQAPTPCPTASWTAHLSSRRRRFEGFVRYAMSSDARPNAIYVPFSKPPVTGG